MLHKPTERKLPKKYNRDGEEDAPRNQRVPSQARLAPKPAPRQASVKGKMTKIEEKLEKVSSQLTQSNMQSMLIHEIRGIKDELRQIKEHIGISKKGSVASYPQVSQQQYQEQEEESIYPTNAKFTHEQRAEESQHFPVHQQLDESVYEEERAPVNAAWGQLFERKKEMIQVGKIQPYMKDFKVESTKYVLPYYYGYHKKSSKPVVIKYCPEHKTMDTVFNLYERLWKNIVKAKKICINKVYDLNEPLATYILVIDANKHSLQEMLSNSRSVGQILGALLRGLQFFHECGFLYRNVHPSHVMQSYEGEVVWIDLKNMRRFVDMKGKCLPVVKDQEGPEDQFISNSRVRGLNEGRKDDLESLGYLALYILDRRLPWNQNNLVQVRSKLTLKELCGRYPKLLEYMIIISQMQTDDIPDYNNLVSILEKL